MQTPPISKNTHYDVINQGMSRDTKKPLSCCQTSEIPFNIQKIRTIGHFILKTIARYSILCGGSSDYIKPNLNTLEIIIHNVHT